MNGTTYIPSVAEVETLAKDSNLIPVYREINADLETPVSAYLKVARSPYSFLLESVEGGENIARYSFIGTEPMEVITTGVGCEYGTVDPLVLIEKSLSRFKLAKAEDLPRFNGGAVGYLSYETVKYFERLPSVSSDPLGLPESVFMLTMTFLVFDHLRHKIQVVSHAHVDGDVGSAYAAAVSRIEELVKRLNSPVNVDRLLTDKTNVSHKVTSNMSIDYYRDMVERAKEYIVKGDIIQAVVSQRLSRTTSAHPFQIYRSLRAINPSPYMYYLDLDGFQIVGASPEMLVQVEGSAVATHPIAGTRPRGSDLAEDNVNERELRIDEKEQAEHIMLLDLGRNDIGRVSEPGTVEVTEMMEVERYSHVMHLVSNVKGRLMDHLTNYDALRACFPAGTVSGAPKIRAMEIISELEPDKRGPYAGSVGYFDLGGNMDTAITIRTLVMKDGVAYAQAGGGIVYDSVPEAEYQETLHKASALLRAIDEAESQG